MLVFGAGAYLDETLDPIWRLSVSDLGLAAAGAVMTAAIEYGRLRHRIPRESVAWLCSRADLQYSTAVAFVLFMLIVPWSFFVVGERGLFIVLIGGNTALDTWLASRR